MGLNFQCSWAVSVSNNSSYFCTCSTWKYPITLMTALDLIGLMWPYHTILPPLLWSCLVRVGGRVQTVAWVWAEADSHSCLCTLLPFYLCPPEQAICLGPLLPFSLLPLTFTFSSPRALASGHQCWKAQATISCPYCPTGHGSFSPILALSSMTTRHLGHDGGLGQ